MKTVWTIVLSIACLLLLPGGGGVNVVTDSVDEAASEPATARQPESEPTPEQPPVEQQWGMEIQSLRLSAADTMLDFRYRVTDPDKVHELLKRGLKPYLLDKATGVKMNVPSSPKIGPLRTTALKPQKDRTYYVMFANHGRLVKRGTVVDIVIGDFVAKDIAVQ